MSTETRAIHINKPNGEDSNSCRYLLFNISGIAALFAGILFMTSIIDLILIVIQPGSINNWLSLFQNNWLIVIFKIHADFSGVHIDLLHILNFLDIAILALIGTMALGLYAILRKTSGIWSLIAMALPFLGIVLFIATKTAGRSAVMGTGLVISILMLRNRIFNRITGYLGILASVLLMVGDFSAGVLHSNIITTLFGIGYVLMMAWLIWIALKLFHLGQNTKG